MHMKKNWKTSIALCALALIMALPLSACGKAATPAEIMQTAQEKLAAVKSMSYVMTMDMEMAVEEQSVEIAMDATADYIVVPVTMHMDMAMDMGAMGSVKTQTYLQENDGEYILYSAVDDGSGELAWMSQTLEGMDSMAQYNAQASMNMYLSSADSFAENGTETINGSEATRYDGIISRDAMNEVMTASGVLDQFAGLEMDEGEMESMMTDLGDLPISIWVDNKSGVPVQYSMDMTTPMQNMLQKMMERLGSTEEITVGKVLIHMTISNFDGVESITIPEEALNSAQ